MKLEVGMSYSWPLVRFFCAFFCGGFCVAFFWCFAKATIPFKKKILIVFYHFNLYNWLLAV